jgi:hypothetical protein
VALAEEATAVTVLAQEARLGGYESELQSSLCKSDTQSIGSPIRQTRQLVGRISDIQSEFRAWWCDVVAET